MGATWLVLLVALSACRRKSDEPIEECMDYARVVEPCFGERAAKRLRASFSIPPREESAREALRVKCVEQRARVRRICR